MTLDETIQKLIDLKLHALAKSLREMMEMPPDRQLSFEDKLGTVSRHPNRRVAGRHGGRGQNHAVARARFARAAAAENWA